MKVGVFTAKVIAICPNKEELSKILGKEIKKDIQYVDKDVVKIVVVLKDIHSDYVGFCTFILKNELLKYGSGKYSYKNRLGQTLAFEKDKVYPSFYMNGDVEICVKGEPELLNFMKNWILLDKDDSLEYKRSKLFEGNFSELRNKINSTVSRPVCCISVIQTDLTGKDTALVYNKAFSPASSLEYFKNTVYNKESVRGLLDKKENKVKLEPYQEFILSIAHPKYPCPYFFHLGPLKTYIREENIVTKNDSLLK